MLFLSALVDIVNLDFTSEKYARAYARCNERLQIGINVMDSNVFHALIFLYGMKLIDY
jgi:hypothetical protein